MKVIKAILSIITAIFLIVGIPIIINECYKADCGYITVWCHSRLNYCGSNISHYDHFYKKTDSKRFLS